ncbi:MAG: hypothetical protein A2762_05000 [Candidatus Lloydbacteria bacterium RIFCSPHIGHO2_01_FULL_54_11]|nr:MAG: hypothetical protein A2762_05000 [Candidatus Lloydbacteria bacterium RIFCSPHIGHO2_01_FULL_54_11]OGZ16385.1 MAG: hypothetical protein A3H76_03315 [Candidatus Lloydbacteria bacterium RIFCSPLOWO2_02_FULL_54_12]
MRREEIVERTEAGERDGAPEEDIAIAEFSITPERGLEIRAEEMLRQMEIADARLDIEGKSRLGESWDKAMTWGKAGWEWAKRPSETYAEALGKAALFSAGTTVFLAPVFLYRNCKQVYDARRGERGQQFAGA